MEHAQHRSGREHLGIRQFAVTPKTRLDMDEAAELSARAESDEVSAQPKDVKDANEFVARKTSIELEESEEDQVGPVTRRGGRGMDTPAPTFWRRGEGDPAALAERLTGWPKGGVGTRGVAKYAHRERDEDQARETQPD